MQLQKTQQFSKFYIKDIKNKSQKLFNKKFSYEDLDFSQTP